MLKVADFGFAQQLASAMQYLKSTKGTRATLAPQVIEGKYTNLCDIWSLGVTLFYMVYRTYPFKKKAFNTDVTLIKAMRKGKLVFPEEPKISKELEGVHSAHVKNTRKAKGCSGRSCSTTSCSTART